MKRIIFAISLVVFLATSCSNTNSGGNMFEREKSTEELRWELKVQEQRNPTQYLKVDATMRDSTVQTRRETLFRSAEYKKDGSVIKGTIKNSASVAKFKDVVLTVSYYSATDTEIESEDFVIYKYFNPNSTKSFSLHVHEPAAMDKFGVRVKTATPVD